MNRQSGFGIILFLMFLINGCTTLRPVPLSPAFWDQKEVKIGVAVMENPKLYPMKAGSQGLLDLAINTAMANSLQKHLEEMDISSFYLIRDKFTEKLQSENLTTASLPDILTYQDFPEFAKRVKMYPAAKIKPLKDRFNVDKLILLAITNGGTIRSYYGFIPLGNPQATMSVKGEMINLENGQIEWRFFDTRVIGIHDPWDQPPSYPNADKSIMQAFTMVMDSLEKNFFYSRSSKSQANKPAEAAAGAAAQNIQEIPDELAVEGDTVTGYVGQSGAFTIIMKGDANQIKYSTGKITSYSPQDWRAMPGDKVKFRFETTPAKNGDVKYIIPEITLLEENKFYSGLPNPVEATAVNIGRKLMDFQIQGTDQIIKFEKKRGMQTFPSFWKVMNGDKVKITYEKIPGKGRNCYIYLVTSLEQIE